MDHWSYWNGVTLDFSRPGKPTDNAVIESFNSRLRQEGLNENWFLSVADIPQQLLHEALILYQVLRNDGLGRWRGDCLLSWHLRSRDEVFTGSG